MKICTNGLVAAGADDTPPLPAQVEVCRQWLSLFARPRKTINVRRSSYGLKHAVEAWASGYVSNGAFIAAAVAEGYRVRQIGRGTNANFNMSFLRPRSG